MEEKCLQIGNKLLNRERDVSNPLMYFFNVVDNAVVVRNPGKWRHLTRPCLNPRTYKLKGKGGGGGRQMDLLNRFFLPKI